MASFSRIAGVSARLLPRLKLFGRQPRPTPEDDFAPEPLNDFVGESEAEDAVVTLDEENETPAAPEPPDVMAVAASIMVDLALADPATRQLAFSAAGLVVIAVPTSVWVKPISTAWHIASGRAAKPLTADEIRHLSPRRLRERQSPVIFLREDKPHRGGSRDRDDFSLPVAAGLPVIGISPTPDSMLPPELLRAADLRLTIPGPDAVVVSALAARLFGQPCSTQAPEARWQDASPLHLVLARRLATTPDEYLANLAALLPKTMPSRTAQALADLPGMGEATEWAKSVLRDVTEIRSGGIGWSALDRGAVLFGPPGTGKTSLVRALAADAKVTLVPTSYAAWQSAGDGYLGDVIRSLREAFEDARREAPSILFIDELDTLGSRQVGSRGGRSGHRDDWWRSIINALLEAMDGALAMEGVLVIGATNDISVLDPALLRAGRLERHIRVSLPDAAGLASIFRVHLGTDLQDADISALASAAQGSSGADVERWVRAARRRARHSQRPIALGDLRDEVLPAATSNRTTDFERVIATHEAGHCVVTCLLRPGTLARASMTAGVNAEATTATLQPETEPMTEAWLADQLVMRLAGRAAEHELLGFVTGGSGGTTDSDLANATWLAASAEQVLGFGGSLLWRGLPNPEGLHTAFAVQPGLERRVTARMDAAYEHARQLMREHTAAVEAVAAALIARRVLTGSEIEALVRGEALP